MCVRYVQEDWVLCRVFQKTKGDGGDGQDGDYSSSSPAFAGTSQAMPDPDYYSAASSAGSGYYGLAFAPPPPQQQEEVAAPVLPQYYYGGTVDVDHHHHHHGFTRDDNVGAALPGFGGAMMRGSSVAAGGDQYGFGYFDMGGGGFDDMASFGGGDMDFVPQVWS